MVHVGLAASRHDPQSISTVPFDQAPSNQLSMLSLIECDGVIAADPLVSRREVRLALFVNPLYEFEANYAGLSSTNAPAGGQAGLGAFSLQALMGFHAQMQGQFGTFLYTDPDDNTVTGGAISAGDGTTHK